MSRILDETLFPTTEQQTILDAVKTTKANLMIRARAGCGKTTMLEMIDAAEKTQPYLLMCFNKAIATEAEKRMRSATTAACFSCPTNTTSIVNLLVFLWLLWLTL